MNNPIDKNRKQTEEQIFYNLMRIVQEYPQYTISQHLSHVLRTKGDSEQAYYWDNQKLLKKFEDYRDELDRELSTTTSEDAV